MRTHFFLAIALLLFASAPALAGRAEECRRRCGDDAACYRRCIAYTGYSQPDSGWGHKGSRPRAYRRAPAANGAPPTEAPRSEPRAIDAGPSARPSILGTAYDFIYAPGTESEGYGLYSYVILPRASGRGVAFLTDVLANFPSAENAPAQKNRINILYIPTKASSKDKVSFASEIAPQAVKKFVLSDYDFAMAQRLLFHLCDQPARAVAQICQNDLSGGPYLLTYATRISDLTPLPPPFLFVDLTNVHPRAFPLFVSAYASQVKRPDFADGARLDDLSLLIANITFTAADWVQPVGAAVADIMHYAGAKKDDGEAPK